MKSIAILLSCLLLIGSLPARAQDDGLYHRVKVQTGTEGLQKMAEQGIAVDHGFFKKDLYFVTDLSEQEIEIIETLGLEYVIEIENVGLYYRERNKNPGLLKEYDEDGCVNCPDYPTPENFELGSYAGFYTYQEMQDVLDSMRARFPELITAKQPIGSYSTNDGNQILYVKISDHPDVAESDEEQVLYTALHHAREVQSLSQLIFYMWYLLENYGTDQEITALIDSRELYFVPCLNPDGYVYNESTEPEGGGMWRKNRRNNGFSYGVDLNRNYGSHWGYDDIGSSSTSYSETYRGPAAFSENETQAIRDFCVDHNFKIALNAHTFSNLLIYPYGHIPSYLTPDSNTFRCIAEEMAVCSGFITGTGNETVGYVTNGDSDDWMYDEQSTKNKIFSLTPEAGSYEDGFWPISSRIIPIAKNTLQQNLLAARLAGAYCEVKPEPFPALTALDNDIPIHFKRTGIDPGGSYTVSLVPVSSNILSVGDPRIYTATEIGAVLSDSIALHLDAGTPLNEEVTYAIKWQHSSGFELSDTFHTRYAILDTIYYNACDHMEGMSGSWDVSMTEFTSAPGSFTETPAGNYPPNASIATTTGEWIDLEDVSAALLTFRARWQIEKGFDYVELEAIVEGGGSTTLCGLYTNKGNDNQNNVAAMYDGAQPAWVKEMIDLSAFAGERIKLRYTLNSDPGLEMDGFYVDDITVLSNYDTTLSVLNSNDEDIVASCYPNPARDQVHVQYQLRHLDRHAAFWLTDMTGRRWSEMRLDPASQQQTIDVSTLPSGIYFYQIRTTDGRSAIGKLVIRH